MSAISLLHTKLKDLAEDGQLRWLAPGFAQFLAELHPENESPLLSLAAVLLTELEGRGHSCLDLAELLKGPGRLLGWDSELWDKLISAAPALPTSVREWRDALAECPQVGMAGELDYHKPLVLDGNRLYLRRFWRDESRVADAVLTRVRAQRELDTEQVRHWLDRLFDAQEPGAGPNWQKIACAIAVRAQLSIITGGPGTGKTFTVARLIALLLALAEDPAPLRIALAAPTGKAATRMKQAIDRAMQDLGQRLGSALPLAELAQRIGPALTLHKLLGMRPDSRFPRHSAANPLHLDVLVVDEASMVHLEMMALLLNALPPHAMVIFLGDKDQLESVEAGAVLGDLCQGAQAGGYSQASARYISNSSGEQVPPEMLGQAGALAQQTVMLRKSRRFHGPIGELATHVNEGRAAEAASLLRAAPHEVLAWLSEASQREALDLALQGRDAAPGYRPYLELLTAQPAGADVAAHEAWARQVLLAFDEFRLLCAVREGEWGVGGLNEAVQQRLLSEGWIKARGEWYVGRPVMVTRNDRALEVANGDVGIVLPDHEQGALRVYFLAGENVRSVLASRLAHVETAFAMTVHKSQGSEFRHAAVVLPAKATQVATRELIYTGITRSREYFTLITPEALRLPEAIERRTLRASGLRDKCAGQ